ncbi:hypothetical protein SY88_14310 [Clostridiales bacterium PH28_bin88]|nr:hypothetical protein SY88_14310 [Clostridiales bacterium PH28_bin88]
MFQPAPVLDDRTIAVDALATAKNMAVLNLQSALNMNDPQAKQVHQRMSQEDTLIVDRLQQILQQRGWDQPLPANPQQAQQVARMFGTVLPGAVMPQQQPQSYV